MRPALQRSCFAILLVAPACQTASDDTGGGTQVQHDSDSASPACTVAGSASLSATMPTFAEVTWEGPPNGAVTVLALSDPLPPRVYPTEAPNYATIPFLDVDRVWTLTVHVQTADGTCDSPPIVLVTPPASDLLPDLLQDTAADTPPDGSTVPLLAMSIGGIQPAAVILDPAGGYVWWVPGDAGFLLDRARPSQDGTGVWSLRRSANPDSASLLRHHTWTDGTDETLQLPDAHDDFVEVQVEGDRLAWLVADHRTIGEEAVVGDAIHILDDAGNERTLWSTFDTLPVVENTGWTDSIYGREADWTHAVSLDYDAERDAFLVALRNVPCVILVSRASGLATWVLGDSPGVTGDFTFVGAAPLQGRAPSFTETGILLFENGDQENQTSAATEFAVDWDTKTVTRGTSMAPAGFAYAYDGGDARRLDNTRTVATWGSLGIVTEFNDVGEPTWQLHLPVGASVGRLDLPAHPWETPAP